MVINTDMYPVSLQIILNYKDTAQIKKMLKYEHKEKTYFEYHLDKSLKGVGAHGVLISKGLDAVLIMRDFDFTSGYDNASLIHEITHASIRHGYKLGFKNAYECEEFYAYYSDFIVNKLYTKLWCQYLAKKK